jgi:hypothetical protein
VLQLELVQPHDPWHGIDKKWDEKVFRERGAPDEMANGYKAYYGEMIAKGFGDTSGSKNLPPPAV